MSALNSVVPAIHRRRARGLACALVAAAALAACGGENEPGAAPAGGGMPPPQVGVVTVAPHAVGLTDELPGRLEASRVAQVRARAAGILNKRLFREGSDVKAGQALFEIDAAPYRALPSPWTQPTPTAPRCRVRRPASRVRRPRWRRPGRRPSASSRWWRPMPSAGRST